MRKKSPLIGMAVTILAALAVAAPGQMDPADPNGRPIGADRLYYGAAYYPEHWPASEIDRDTLSSKTGTVLATYGNGLADGKPAIIEARTGKGKVVILGTDPGTEALGKLLLRLAGEAGIRPMAQGEAGVVVVPRAGGNASGWVVVNVTGTTKKISLESGSVDLLSGREQSGALELAPYDVMVLQRSARR